VHLKSFWNKALAGEIPTWNMSLELLKNKAQEISDQSILLKTLSSCRKENAMEHGHFNFFWKKNECTPKRKCHGCGKLQVICKLHPCDKKLPRIISNTMDTFQSYTYGSGQILNSCYIDTFLEAIYHPFTRQITPATTNFNKTTLAMDTLLESIVTREQGKFQSPAKWCCGPIYATTQPMDMQHFLLARWLPSQMYLVLFVRKCHNRRKIQSL